MPPFQREQAENNRRRGGPSVPLKPFGDEEEEDDDDGSRAFLRKRKVPSKPFEEEDSESGNERPSASSIVDGSGVSSATFNLGWAELTKFAKSHAWSQKAVEEKQTKQKKRTYDNSKRSATAKMKPGRTISSNGADAQRVAALLLKTCECALIHLVLFCFCLFKCWHLFAGIDEALVPHASHT